MKVSTAAKFLIAVVSVMISPGCISDLSRQEAADKISKVHVPDETQSLDIAFSERYSYLNDYNPAEFIKAVNDYVIGDTAFPLIASRFNDGSQADEDNRNALRDFGQAKELHEKGILKALTLVRTVQILGNGGRLNHIDFKAVYNEPYASACRNKNDQDSRLISSCTIAVATKEFHAVTGVTGDDKSKEVEFTVDVIPTDAGTELGKQPSTEKRRAFFNLYDDGWRIVRLE